MKNRISRTMAPLAVLAAMLIVFFSLSAANETKAKTTGVPEARAKAKVVNSGYDSWANLNRAFAWHTAGRTLPRSGSNEGC